MTTHIKSKEFGDCLACCLAMATGTDLLYVTEGKHAIAYNHDAVLKSKYVPLTEAIIFLAKHKFAWGISAGCLSSLKDVVKEILIEVSVEIPAIITIQSCVKGATHGVYWDGKNVYDPCEKEPYQDIEKLGAIIQWSPIQKIDPDY